MSSRPRLKDRLFTLLCVAGAAVFMLVGASRGNWRVALLGAAFFLGYAVLHAVTRRLTPAARLVTGDEADAKERLAQFRAIRTAGQVALGLAALGLLAELVWQWQPGAWVAATALTVIVSFVAALWLFSRSDA